MRYYLVVFIGLIFSGCSITKAPLTEYIINIDIPKKEIESKKCNNKSIKVSQSFSTNKLQTLNMNYCLGTTKIYSYSQSIWAESPSSAITSEVVKLLRNKKLFKTVQISRSRGKSDLILETSIDKFMQSFDTNLNNSYSSVFITFTIIDSKTNQVISSKSFKAKEFSKTLDASGGVEALNKALSVVLLKSAYWFEEVCK